MSSVWFVGRADARVVLSADWDGAGVTGTGDFRWSPANGYSYSTTAFNTEQLAWLDAQNTEFWVGAPDGPRTIVIADPVGYTTEARVREILSSTAGGTAAGLTKASVGLGNVDNTGDLAKPLSTATTNALASKVNLPSGGTDGQTLVKAGATVAWAQPSQTGGNQGSFAVQQVADTYWPSGYVYEVTGSGVAATSDSFWPSGTVYSIN